MTKKPPRGSKPPRITRTIHILPFEKLSWLDFERLCLWVIKRSGFEQVEHLGAAGSDRGIDIAAMQNHERWVFQCKRVRRFGPAQAIREVKKILSLPAEQRPSGITFIVTCPVSIKTREQVQTLCVDKVKCKFWSETELDEKVKRHPFVVEEFFEDSRRELRMVGGSVSGTALADGSNVYMKYSPVGEHGYNLREIRVDFAPYLSRLIESFERDALVQHYVDLNCSRLELELENENGMPTLKGSWGKTNESVNGFFEGWLSTSSQRQLSILGDFGSGKTTLCRRIAYALAKRHLADPESNRIPLLINLANSRDLGTIENIITHFFKQEWGLELDQSILPWLTKAGRLCVILDGFDEMAARVDRTVRRESFEMIGRLAQSPSKVVVTGRPGYFPELLEMCEIFGRDLVVDSYQQLQKNLSRYLGSIIEFEILRINPLSNIQIDKVLQSYDAYFVENEFCTWQDIRALIDKVYDLKDLARRPILLDLAIRTLPQLRKTNETLDALKIYELYTDYWCEVEWHKGEMRRLQTSAERREIIRFLACEMYWSGRTQISFEEIPNHIRERSGVSGQQLEWLEHDIRTCSFLTLSNDGLFEFVHSSFIEYFLADALYVKAVNGSLKIYQESVVRPFWKLERSRPLTDGATVFLKSLVERTQENDLSKILYYKTWAWGKTQEGLEILWVPGGSRGWT